ncbi:MAG: uracil-DNA glycosylase [Proteobacteria bacterium]|nr:uracil-DNA glycosylase [Pseudomonadota bacterium]
MAVSEVSISQVQAVLGSILRTVSVELSEWLECQQSLGADSVPADESGYGQWEPARAPVQAPSASQIPARASHERLAASSPKPSVVPAQAKPGIGLAGCLASFNAMRSPEVASVSMDREAKTAALAGLRSRTLACRQCRLGGVRRDIMWGTGPADASIMFVAAGGNPHELEVGRIITGEAGALLDKIIAAMAKLHPEAAPDRIYMTNVIKCASFPNQAERKDVAKCCLGILREEVRIIAPKVIVVWGQLAYQAMFGGDAQISQVRGEICKFENIPTIATHHPLELIKNENLKGRTWADVKLAAAQLPQRI